MSASRGGVLQIGARVRFGEAVQTVVGLSGTLVRLAGQDGQASVVQLAHLLASEGFEIIGGAGRMRPPLSAAALGGVPQDAVQDALRWERHIIEILTGALAGAAPGTAPRPGYDPAACSLAQREQAKAAELAASGEKVTARTVRRRRQRYEARGLAGLVDWRAGRSRPARGRTDERVVAALQQAISEQAAGSTRTASFYLWRTRQILAERHGQDVVPMPARATFYRLFERVTAGLHTTGSARTRQSLANRPGRPFSQLAASRPGEVVEIDSTPFDVMVLLDDGVAGRAELTGMVDLATRTVTAAVLRPTTKSVDAALLLARTVTPEPMQPGWADALSMARSVLPHQRLLELDQRLAHAAARPVIVPETIVCDHGKAFISQNFRSSCRLLGITFQPAHPRTPTDKPHIERTLESVASLFAQFVSGYLGRSAEFRGHGAGNEPLWPLMELQGLLDEWVIACWQNRPHDGLRDPAAPGRALTPNEKYAALVQAAGYVPVALSAGDYIELLPAAWRAINAYGVKISHRVYDSEELNPFRGQRSGVAAKQNLWEIHCDPYDVSRIWVRNHWDGGWITVFWKHLSTAPAPFGELAWDHARRQLAADGRNPAEQEIAQAVESLLQRALQGPAKPGRPGRKPAAKDRRVAARTRATAQPSWPRPAEDGEPRPAAAGSDQEQDELAAVIPLPVFDAREEAKKWW
ncbi:MAG: Mu transposase C-terminal domain-containing protein [Streptosporangiaceae bacterium]